MDMAGSVVLANGCFDLLHLGHLRHLQEARMMGQWLVVAVTMDKYVGKGPHRPIQPVEDRMEMLRGLHCVSAVTMCKDSLDALEQWRPRVFAKGYEYRNRLLLAEVKFCRKHKIQIAYTKPRPEGYSTTQIIERLQCA